METINLRINYLAEKYFNGNNVKFAESVESSEANIRNYRKEGVPKIEFIVKTCNLLKINPDWLLTGSGEILQEVAAKSNFNPEIEKFLNLKNVFSEIFERLEKLEQNTDGLAIGHTVNQEIAKIIDEKIIEKK